MRRQWARVLGLLLGYLACVLGLRLVDRVEDLVSTRVDEEAAA
jgi:hypothetical protein